MAIGTGQVERSPMKARGVLGNCSVTVSKQTIVLVIENIQQHAILIALKQIFHFLLEKEHYILALALLNTVMKEQFA